MRTEGAPPTSSPVTARLLTFEGLLGEVFVSLSGGAFLTGAARLLGAGPFALSLLVGLPFLAQLGQLLGPVLEQRLQSRRRFVVPTLVAGRLLWLVPTALVLSGANGPAAVATAVAATTLLAVIAMVGANGWMAWMAEAIPAESRARLFGARAAGVAAGTLIAGQGGAWLLDWLRHRGHQPEAFGVLGGIAVLCGALSALLLRRVPDAPPRPVPPEPLLAVGARLMRLPKLRRILGFFLLWNVAIGLPAPFWTLYMLERLDMSFSLIALHTSVVVLIRLLVSNAWSRVIERVGSQGVLIGASVGIAAIPVLWMFPRPDSLLPIWIEAVFSGIFWSGFNQAAFLAPLAAVGRRDRSRGLALFNLATGCALFVASVGGGALLSWIGAEGRTGFQTLFVVSAALRLTTGLLGLRLGEPGVSLKVFFFHFIGYGVLRQPSWGRQLVPAGDDDPDESSPDG